MRASERQAGCLAPTVLSIVVVNWNARDLLRSCLRSIYANPQKCSFDVTVVDNASADGSTDMVRQCFPEVRLIENRRNVGFAHANNQGIRRSNGRLILLLNPDTEVQAGALQALTNFLDGQPRAGAVGPRLLNPDGSLQPSCHPTPTLAREFWRLFHLDAIYPYARYPMHRWDQDTPRRVDVIQGACLLLRRDALDQVGLLDEDYFMYSEEVDLCTRLRRAGWQIYWVPRAKVVHYGAQSTRQVADEMFLQLHRSKVLYFRKHCNNLTVRLYKLLLFAAALARLAGHPVVWLAHPSRRQDILTLAGRYRQLIAALPEI